jgi:uncharacterized protein YegP (UPF0339 family)
MTPRCFSRASQCGYHIGLQTVSKARPPCPRTMPAGGPPLLPSRCSKPPLACRGAARPPAAFAGSSLPTAGEMEQSMMSGQFEVFSSPHGGYRFRLVDAAGNTWATSGTYPTKRALAAAIALVREIAGTGLVRDQSEDHSREPLRPGIRHAEAARDRTGSTAPPQASARSPFPNRHYVRANT